jgi:hypothetical protein
MAPPDQPATEPLIERRPVLVFVGGLAAVVDAGILAANTLGWVTLTAGQISTSVAFVTAAAALVATTLQARVWSPATVRAAGIAT